MDVCFGFPNGRLEQFSGTGPSKDRDGGMSVSISSRAVFVQPRVIPRQPTPQPVLLRHYSANDPVVVWIIRPVSVFQKPRLLAELNEVRNPRHKLTQDKYLEDCRE